MKVAIHQPNYLPWCGFFAKMKACDTFVILDDVPISNARTYVSRTKIRAGDADRWLTIPTSIRGTPPIDQVEFADLAWPQKHLATLRHTYGKSSFFDDVMAILEPSFSNPGGKLSAFNQRLLGAIAAFLGIERQFVLSSSLGVHATSDDRLIELVRKVGGTTYISGAGGTNYQSPPKFEAAAIKLDVRVYQPVPYEALKYPFIPGLSIVDALFVRGREAVSLLNYS